MITIAIVACLGRSVCIIHRLCGGIRSASAALAQPAQTRGSSSPVTTILLGISMENALLVLGLATKYTEINKFYKK